MEIQKNIAAALCAIKEQRNLSISEFAEELEISRSALQEYLAGEGNPSANTINHMARKLSISPSLLVTGEFTNNQLLLLLCAINNLKLVSGLSPAKREKFAKLLLQLISLCDEKEDVNSEEGSCQ